MFCPVTSSAMRWAVSEVKAPLRAAKELISRPLQGLVDHAGVRGATGGGAALVVDLATLVQRHEGLLGGVVHRGQQVAIGLGDRGDLGGEGEEGAPVLA